MRNLVHIVYIINSWSLGGRWLIAGRWLHGPSSLSWVNGNRHWEFRWSLLIIVVDFTLRLLIHVIFTHGITVGFCFVLKVQVTLKVGVGRGVRGA